MHVEDYATSWELTADQLDQRRQHLLQLAEDLDRASKDFRKSAQAARDNDERLRRLLSEAEQLTGHNAARPIEPPPAPRNRTRAAAFTDNAKREIARLRHSGSKYAEIKAMRFERVDGTLGSPSDPVICNAASQYPAEEARLADASNNGDLQSETLPEPLPPPSPPARPDSKAPGLNLQILADAAADVLPAANKEMVQQVMCELASNLDVGVKQLAEFLGVTPAIIFATRQKIQKARRYHHNDRLSRFLEDVDKVRDRAIEMLQEGDQ